jgi:glycosyltransferase involved in cell wall biosynthesis
MLDMSDEQFRGSGFALEREFSWSPDYRAGLRTEWQFADRIIAPSSFVKTSLTMAGASPDDIVVIPYGCPPVARHRACRAPSGRLSLLFVGQFVWRKGVDHLTAFAREIDRRADLTVVSRGMRDDRLLAEIKVQPNVKVMIDATGAQLRECYERADALIFPSRFEGYGVVINEALSHGLPVISTRNTALPDILRTHCVGSLMNNLSSEAMLASLAELFDRGIYSNIVDCAIDYAESSPWSVFRQRVRDAALI